MILRLLSYRRRATEKLFGHSGRHFDLGIWTAACGRPYFSHLSFSTASLFLSDVSSGGNGFLEEGAYDSLHHENLKVPEVMQPGLELKASSAAPQGIYKAILIGEAGHAPSQKILKDGSTVTLFSLGTSGMRNNRKPYENETPDNYARRSLVQWHRIAIYQFRLGALAMKSVKRGSQVYVEGSLETRVFLEPESNSIKRVQEIAVRQNGRIIFLDQNKAKV